jgi:hypothetical protein
MMGHREALNSGDEVDAVGSHRHDHHWRPGERKAIKQQLGKRARSGARLALRMAALRGFTGGKRHRLDSNVITLHQSQSVGNRPFRKQDFIRGLSVVEADCDDFGQFRTFAGPRRRAFSVAFSASRDVNRRSYSSLYSSNNRIYYLYEHSSYRPSNHSPVLTKFFICAILTYGGQASILLGTVSKDHLQHNLRGFLATLRLPSARTLACCSAFVRQLA